MTIIFTSRFTSRGTILSVQLKLPSESPPTRLSGAGAVRGTSRAKTRPPHT
jgi:hypothetical protein